MLKGLGDIASIMKMQKDFKSAQKTITRAKIQGMSPDESVTVVMTGDFKLDEIRIEPELAKSGDSKKIERAVFAAVNSTVDKVKEFSAAEMAKLTGGMNIPGLMDFLK